MNDSRPIIGWREWITLPDHGISAMKVKVDTGARTSSLHAESIAITDDQARVVTFTTRPWQDSDADAVTIELPLLSEEQVRSSNGAVELRPVVAIGLQLGDVHFQSPVTLTDRSEQTGAHDDVDNEFGDLCSSGEFGLIEIRISCILFGEIAEESGAVAVGECPYLGEAESLLCKAPDFSNSVEMVIVIEGATAFTARRRKQLFALVVANRVDRDSGPVGEFFDVVVHAHIVGVVTPRVATRLDGQRLRSAS